MFIARQSLNLSSHPTTINGKNFTTNIATRPTRQKHNTALEIIRAAPSPSRNSRQDALRPLLIIDERRVHLSRDIARRNSVDSNALRRPLVAQRFGQLRNTTLARRVRRNRQPTLETQQRRDIDDGTSAAVSVWLACEHVCADFAAEGEDCAEVDLQHFVPVVVGELVRRVAALDAAAVEENMDNVAVFEDFRDERVDRGGRSEVCGVYCCFAAEGFDGLFGGLVGLVTLVNLLGVVPLHEIG
jgi:hypothetical protein